jgi:transcriptional regulator with XRE-family HTH domain
MIRAARLSYGMTVAELARRTQLSAVALSAIEHGRVALPNFAVVASIAHALKVSLDTFAEADMPLPSRKKPARTPRTRKAVTATVTVTGTDTPHPPARRRTRQAASAD